MINTLINTIKTIIYFLTFAFCDYNSFQISFILCEYVYSIYTYHSEEMYRVSKLYYTSLCFYSIYNRHNVTFLPRLFKLGWYTECLIVIA